MTLTIMLALLVLVLVLIAFLIDLDGLIEDLINRQ